MSVLVFGAGAIGTYVGASLIMSGQRVVFLEQPKTAEELRDKGLRLVIPNEKSSPFILPAKSFRVVGSLKEAFRNGPFDIAIYALKSFDTETAVNQIAQYADDMPPIVCLSNGVENEDVLSTVLGKEKIIAGTVTSAVTRYSPGNIVLEKLRGVGVADGHPLSLWVWEVMNAAKLYPRLYKRPTDMKWSKMLTNLLANASVAILDISPRELLANPELFKLEIRMLRETLDVMRVQGIHVVDTPRTPVRLLAIAVKFPLFITRSLIRNAASGGRGAKMPSFHIDLHTSRGKSEVEWLNGAVVRYGKNYGVATPVNKLFTEILSGMTRKDIPISEYKNQPMKLVKMMERYQ
jgi:2-dehydropantoate 2-reductase